MGLRELFSSLWREPEHETRFGIYLDDREYEKLMNLLRPHVFDNEIAVTTRFLLGTYVSGGGSIKWYLDHRLRNDEGVRYLRLAAPEAGLLAGAWELLGQVVVEQPFLAHRAVLEERAVKLIELFEKAEKEQRHVTKDEAVGILGNPRQERFELVKKRIETYGDFIELLACFQKKVVLDG